MFLPQNYEAPKAPTSYMKIQQGENKIRILSQPILGWEEWTKDKKPVRYHYDKKPDKPLNPKEPPRHFWAFIVWNYNEEAIQILQVTQAGIRKGLEALCKDSDWGEPYHYDIKIIKEGEEMKTKYMVNPLPHKPISSHIIEAFNEKPIKLEALFDGDDPFAVWTRTTPGIFTRETNNELEAFLANYGVEKELMREYTQELAEKMEWNVSQTIERLRRNFDETKASFENWKKKRAA